MHFLASIHGITELGVRFGLGLGFLALGTQTVHEILKRGSALPLSL